MVEADDRTPGERGARATRERLLDAAERRFAADGYRGATVRGIADDARVNVALISRYFGSKEGLFEACVNRGDPETGGSTGGSDRPTAEEIVERLIEQIVSPADAVGPLQLLILLRSSGDADAEAASRQTLERFTRTLARAAGWDERDPATSGILLQAQTVLAAAAGLILFRGTTQVEPIASTSADDLAAHLRTSFAALLA
jgi:AcrR family transcriptional regulator